MLTCQLRLINENEDEEEVLEEAFVKETLVDLLSTYGLVEDVKCSTKTISKSASFQVQMSKPSEALLAVEKLNGTSYNLTPKTIAMMKFFYGGVKSASIRIEFQQIPSSETILKTVRRRFACCGTIKKCELDGKNSVIVVFDEPISALRAKEDFKERGKLSHDPFLELFDEEKEKDADKKRHRSPTPQKEVSETSSLEAQVNETETTSAAAEAAASKRSREGVSRAPSSSQSVQDTKRSRDVDSPSTEQTLDSPNLEQQTTDSPVIEQRIQETTSTTDQVVEGEENDKTINEKPRQLFVVHTKNVNVEELTALFSSRPGYEMIEVKRKKKATLRGMTFVTFTNHEDATKAIEELHGIEFPPESGEKLKVMFAEAWDETKRTNNKRESEGSAEGGVTPNVSIVKTEEDSKQMLSSPRISVSSESVQQQQPRIQKRSTEFQPNYTYTPPTVQQHPYSYYPPPRNDSQFYPYNPMESAEVQLERELASRSTTDALAETFGNVMGFGELANNQYFVQNSQPPPPPQHWMYFHNLPPPQQHQAAYYPPMPPTQRFTQNFQPSPLPPPPSQNTFYGLPDASRLHVIFGKPLPEQEVHQAFDMAAPGLQYVSRHKEKPFAFVKYNSSASAMLAMIRLHGSTLLGQKLRVTLADPPPVDPHSRKRHRNVAAYQKTAGSTSEEEEEDEDNYE